MTPVFPPFDFGPCVTLFQKNVATVSRFARSPEMTGGWMSALPAPGSATASPARRLASSAFAQLMQGLLRNYLEFLGEVWRGAWMSSMAPARRATPGAARPPGSALAPIAQATPED